MSHEFLDVWRDYAGLAAPFVLPGDDQVILSKANRCRCSLATNLTDYMSSLTIGEGNDRSLQLGLCPIPFMGNPGKATVFILMLNPGFAPADFLFEAQDDFRRRVWANLKGDTDFIGLDPQYVWTSGFTYWHAKLRPTIRAVSERLTIGYQEAMQHVAASVCVLQLVPYRSASFSLSDRVLATMRSPALVKAFVHDLLVPRAARNEVLLVVTRQARQWGLTAGDRTIIYAGPDTRAAHLGGSSPAGPAILEMLTRGSQR